MIRANNSTTGVPYVWQGRMAARAPLNAMLLFVLESMLAFFREYPSTQCLSGKGRRLTCQSSGHHKSF